MQIRPGSLLIAHPVHSHPNCGEQVVYITDSNPNSTTGLILNNLSGYDLKEIMADKNIDWYGDNRLFIGGDNNESAMIMLHTDEWYSSNTIQINDHLCMSSDDLMMEKLEMGNVPEWYRLFLGFEGWDALDLEHQLRSRKPEWLLLSKPSQALIELADKSLWHNAVAEYSQDVFDTYF